VSKIGQFEFDQFLEMLLPVYEVFIICIYLFHLFSILILIVIY